MYQAQIKNKQQDLALRSKHNVVNDVKEMQGFIINLIAENIKLKEENIDIRNRLNCWEK